MLCKADVRWISCYVKIGLTANNRDILQIYGFLLLQGSKDGLRPNSLVFFRFRVPSRATKGVGFSA